MVKIAPATIIGIITILVLILIAMGLFNQPDITLVRQKGQSRCPPSIRTTFDLKFLNHGNDDAVVHAELSADTIKFKIPEDEILVPPAPTPTTLSFDIDLKTTDLEPEHIKIDYKWHYRKFYILKQKNEGTCEYINDKSTPRHFILA